MTEATWGDATSTDVDWRMSAALECVPRGESNLAEVTSLEGAVRAWLELDDDGQAQATLTPERPLVIDGVSIETLSGDSIASLAGRLPARTDDAPLSEDAANDELI